MKNIKVTGYLLAIIAATTYGMNPLFALPLYKAGMDSDSVLFLRYLLAIPILGIMLKARGRSFRLKRGEVLPLAGMGLLVAMSSLMLFQSYHYMEAGIASTLLFVYPIMVALMMAGLFKEKVQVLTWACIALAAVQRRGRRDVEPEGGGDGDAVFAVVCDLYRGGEPLEVEGGGNAEADFLRAAVRGEPLLGARGLRAEPACGERVVHVGEPAGPGGAADRPFVLVHDTSGAIHRLDTDRHPGCAGAGDGSGVRGDDFRGEPDAAHRVRHPADYRRGDHHHRGREYHRLFHPPAETVPAVALAVMLKSAAHETKEGMIR